MRLLCILVFTAAAPDAFKPTENATPWAVLWARWAAAGFRSVWRLSDQQKRLARAGRCHKGRGGGPRPPPLEARVTVEP